LTGPVEYQFKITFENMADENTELDGTRELLQGLSIAQETSHNSHSEEPSRTAKISKSDNVDEEKAKYNRLIKEGKELGRRGCLEKALDLFQKAFEILESEKLQRKIEKVKEAIDAYQSEEGQKEEGNDDNEDDDDDGMCVVGDGFSLPSEIYKSLYQYQLEGILWFWKLFNKKMGGILADDMGLGKTIQVISFLAGMFDASLIKRVLIVMPVSVMPNWENEFNKWAPGIRVKSFHGTNKKERLNNLEKIQRRWGVCLTTYGLIVSSHEHLGEITWDYIILDEGHKIKNAGTKTSKNLREIPAKYHFILTGTPVQNNLREMWALFDFACEGKLLGTSRTFKQEYENPIVRARERDASAYEKRIGMEMSESLRKLIEPHFLRRTKAMVLANNNTETDGVDESVESEPDYSSKMPEDLPRKNDFVIWLKMSDSQIQIYSDFLGLERVKELLMSTRSPLAELNVLKKICDHPRLLSTLACEQLGLDEEARLVEMDTEEDSARSFATQPKGMGPSDKVLTQESGKMVFLVSLLENLKSEGHRCLVFSQSRKMLDIIQRVITHVGHKILRIDGTVISTAERQHIINTFQNDSSYTCFLLTTQVGGVGITLTQADRVVIFDPSWNPASDAQAVDRVYRIGQKKTVVIYRLITCGTLEEKIYRKQIFKEALMKQTTGSSKNPFRYFSRQELRDLFTLDDPYTSKTQMQLEQMHSCHRKTDGELDRHINFLKTLNIFGISDHNLMYSQEAVEAPEGSASPDQAAIEARVLRAQNLVAAEAALSGPGQPGGVPPTSQEGMALPKGMLHSGALSESSMNARQKIQVKIDSERFIKPTPKDTTRFQPKQALQPTTLVEVVTIDEENDGEELVKDFASFRIDNDSPSPEIESDLKTSGDDVDPSEVPLRQCPSGIHDSDVVLIHKCACVISEDEQEQYEACLNNARQQELGGKTEDALMGYMDALELMDSELELHLKILKLGKKMNLHP